MDGADWTFFSDLVSLVATPLQQGLQDKIGPVLIWAGPVGTALIGIYALTQIFRISAGQVSAKKVILEIGVAETFVWLLSAQGLYMQWIGTPLQTTLPNGIISAFGGNTTPGGGLDKVAQTAGSVLGNVWHLLSFYDPGSWFIVLFAGLWFLAVMFLLGIALVVYLDSIIGTAIAVFVCPICLCLGIHPVSRHIFRGWVTLAVGSVAQTIMCIAIMTLMVGVTATKLQTSVAAWALGTPGPNWFVLESQAFLLIAFMTFSIWKTSRFAHTIAGGAGGSSVGNIANIVHQATRAAASGGASLVTGAYSKFSGGGGSSTSGGSSGSSGGGASPAAALRSSAPTGRNISKGS